jgi:iron complex transport system permease protein
VHGVCSRLLLAPLIGALILWLSDQLILWLTRVDGGLNRFDSALIGAPLLLWLLPRLRSMSAPAMNGDSVAMNVITCSGSCWAGW